MEGGGSWWGIEGWGTVAALSALHIRMSPQPHAIAKRQDLEQS